MTVINEFQGKYRWLSNFWPVEIQYDGYKYSSVEHAYQANKSLFDNVRKKFCVGCGLTPGQAKRLGRTVKLRPDWELCKIDIMFDLVYLKFSKDKLLKKLLLDTGNATLIEGNRWGDSFWGVDLRTGKGENWRPCRFSAW